MSNNNIHNLSIVIPTKNRAKYLQETLTNIFINLNKNIDVIIIDGDSNDNTREIVNHFVEMNCNISYVKLTNQEGFDSDLNYGILYSNSEYCWLFSDDDIIYGDHINYVSNEINKYKDLDLILVNSKIYNYNMKILLKESFLDFDNFSGSGTEMLFTNFIDYLSFFGGCIIKRDLWLNSNPNKYFGSLFVHIGVIFSKKNLKWMWIAEPMIKIRYGNASWTNNAMLIWLIKWPNLILNLDNLSYKLKKEKLNITPLNHLKKLVYFKATGKFDLNNSKKILIFYNKIILHIIINFINILPIKLCYIISYIYAKNTHKKILFYDLIQFRDANK